MKKYLMMGATALVLGASFISCSKDTDLYDPNADVQNFVQKYQEAFVKAYGQPAPNQTWGFGDNTTRSENANANEWADPDKAYGGLLVPPPLTDEQIAVVKEYFQTVKNPTYEDPHWTNYFMQQVYKGYTDPRPGYSPEAYLAADGNTYIYASNNMDHLAAINGDFVDHINNFNHGDCSLNGTVLDNGGNANEGPFHSDKIMYMKESTTASFGYYNSNGSVRRTEYTGLVSYQTIINTLGSKANCLNDGWNRSFMGFDFEQMVGPEIQAVELDYSAGWSADIPGGFPIKGYKWYEYNGQQYPLLNSDQNMYCGTPLECNDADLQQDGFIDNLLAQGYLPVDGGANKKWVKVGGCADGYYSDWIVCLTKAEGGPTPPEPDEYSIRIMAEDLSASEASDFDFNDVVFDVKAEFPQGVTEVNTVHITLWAAGGTLPLKINSVKGVGGVEVHAQLSTGDVTEMINTHAFRILVDPYTAVDNKAKQEFDITLPNNWKISKDNFGPDVRDKVRVEVQKKTESGQELWIELTAYEGQAPCKFGVPVGTAWVVERHSLGETFPSFAEWVQTAAPARWYGNGNTANYYSNGSSTTCTHGCNH
jgi:hypothetical protein